MSKSRAVAFPSTWGSKYHKVNTKYYWYAKCDGSPLKKCSIPIEDLRPEKLCKRCFKELGSDTGCR